MMSSNMVFQSCSFVESIGRHWKPEPKELWIWNFSNVLSITPTMPFENHTLNRWNGVYKGKYYFFFFFLFLNKTIDCANSTEYSHQGSSNKHPHCVFGVKIRNYMFHTLSTEKLNSKSDDSKCYIYTCIIQVIFFKEKS